MYQERSGKIVIHSFIWASDHTISLNCQNLSTAVMNSFYQQDPAVTINRFVHHFLDDKYESFLKSLL